ncbi:disulfide bond formation protein B [Formicincola oecophyllae]|uniref:Disulfide bond formation protein B n=1 Tax=Formicincola oecophyllae TaxID=2558361 RepID=A0A4Y6UAK1_9PROT|nr:disulfide bond formation protein B [Formicincola oecophyllae]QDH13486.1 disulfide bond formation protein B [Formicincola oecophyllae]
MTKDHPLLSSLQNLGSWRLCGFLALMAAIFALGFAWYAEHILNLVPCELCLLARWPWRAVLVLGGLAWLGPAFTARLMWFLMLLCLTVGLGIGVTHFGVEHGWWESPFAACHGGLLSQGADFTQWFNSPLQAVKPCDRPDYVWGLPLSLTTLSLLYNAGVLMVLLLLPCWLQREEIL